MKDLTFITGNPYKARYVAKYLSFDIKHKKLDLPEIQSLNIEEVIRAKIKSAYDILQTPVLVEDTSLFIDGLNGLPGPFIKFFYENLGNDKITKIVDCISPTRNATAVTAFGIGSGVNVKVFAEETKGKIALKPTGNSEDSTGWDPIFIPNGDTRTWAEMCEDEKMRTSMRARALQKMEKYFKEKI